MDVLVAFLTWYIVIQLASAAVLPLAVRFFAQLPDRGYAFAKILGPFLVGVTLWLGTSYGLLRNEAGGAWLALAIVAGLSDGFGGWGIASRWATEMSLARRRATIGVEALFLAAFVVWTWVRIHDPAAETIPRQPMDLHVHERIWASPVFPPRDAWPSGYPISYYYLGYWLLTTLGHLANCRRQPYHRTGVVWYGLLLTGSFGVAYNLTALADADQTGPAGR